MPLLKMINALRTYTMFHANRKKNYAHQWTEAEGCSTVSECTAMILENYNPEI